ncbi:hypothetical protein PR202_ga08330 [Eleusine coracana subsp. coracana]|uniref:Crossover junction endonuclease MUS81 n=1 Tax=Eleusine coracana subsp. coracana TaxID=191504 RepID=A0AAV5C1Z0_ELECO|nr:hypothetical protein PR202_ga08330 [Eleusine coracana subsp. coracana]
MALAPPPKQLRVRLPENEGVARCLHEKRLSTHDQTGGLKVNLDRTFAKAYRNVCDSEEPIRTLKDFSKIKGVGPWLIRQMKEFFADSNQDLSPTKGKKTRESKCSLLNKKRAAPSSGSSKLSILRGKELSSDVGLSACSSSVIPFSAQRQIELQSSGTTGSAELNGIYKKDTPYVDNSIWAMPPRQSSEEFHDAYEVVLILDDRENFGCHSRKIAASKVADNIHSQCMVPVEKCGLRKLIYLVEGDPNCSNASERIKTACFTTEILEGFDVLRTSGYADTVKMYSNLTRSIIEYYNANFSTLAESSRVCPTYDEFERNCRCLKRKTVSQIFALQLMQVPQVTEQVALAVIELYPTLLSLAQAYSMLEGDIRAQEEMLKNKSKMVNAGASRNIFKLVWGDGCNLQL